MTDVREAVDRAKVKLPQTAEDPSWSNLCIDFPIITVGIAGEGVDERTIYRSAERLRTEIEGVPGVLEAKLTGAREEVLEATIDPEQLQRLGFLLTCFRRSQEITA